MVWSWSIRLRSLGVNTPTVMITGYPDESILTKATSAGVRYLVLKPNLEDNLVECVRSAIDARQRSGRALKNRPRRLRRTP